MSTTRALITVHCDACRRILPTQRTTTRGARGDAARGGWRIARIVAGDASEDHANLDMCPWCLRRRKAGLRLYAHQPGCTARTMGVSCTCVPGQGEQGGQP